MSRWAGVLMLAFLCLEPTLCDVSSATVAGDARRTLLAQKSAGNVVAQGMTALVGSNTDPDAADESQQGVKYNYDNDPVFNKWDEINTKSPSASSYFVIFILMMLLLVTLLEPLLLLLMFGFQNALLELTDSIVLFTLLWLVFKGVSASLEEPVRTYNHPLYSGNYNKVDPDPVDLEYLKSDNITRLVHKFAPVFYFHDSEKYLPSGLDWFMERADWIDNDPKAKTPYWLIRNISQSVGNLSSAKIITKVMHFEGTPWIDVLSFVFYPYNGPGTLSLFGWDLSTEPTGEHFGDLEHITVRISLETEDIIDAYYAQHSDGQMINGTDLLRQGTHPVVLVSYNGHASFNQEGDLETTLIKLDKVPHVKALDKCQRGNRTLDGRDPNVVDIVERATIRWDGKNPHETAVDRSPAFEEFYKHAGRTGPDVHYHETMFLTRYYKRHNALGWLTAWPLQWLAMFLYKGAGHESSAPSSLKGRGQWRGYPEW